MLWWVMVKRDRVVMLDDDGGGAETIWALMSMGVVVDMVVDVCCCFCHVKVQFFYCTTSDKQIDNRRFKLRPDKGQLTTCVSNVSILYYS